MLILLLLLASYAAPAAPASQAPEINSVIDKIIEQVEGASALVRAGRSDALPLLQKNLDMLADASRRQPQDGRARRIFAEHAPALVMHRLGECNATLQSADVPGAFQQALALATWLDDVQDMFQVEAPVYLVLAELASHAARPTEAADWAQRCERTCSDPQQRARATELIAASSTRVAGRRSVSTDAVTDLNTSTDAAAPDRATPARRPPSQVPKGFRLGLTWIPGPTAGTLQGASVRRAWSVGASIAVQTRHSSGCAQLNVSRDGWSVPNHPSELRANRLRVELTWCPTLLQVGLTDAVVWSVRPQIGGGLSNGRFNDAIIGEGQVVGFGVHAGVHSPFRVGKLEITPAVQLSPYGRATTWSFSPDRRDLAFMDRWSVALGVSYTPRRQ